MNWTTPPELKAQLARLWDRGNLLRSLADAERRFPLRLPLKTPGSSDLTERFEAVRSWAAEIAGLAHARVVWREVRHRVQGDQRLPAEIWVDTLGAALAWLGRRREAERFERLVEQTRTTLPALLPWLSRRPLVALELDAVWPQLLAVVQWVIAHPRPGVYVRQVDVPGVHSKFIEAHRGVLAEMLDLVLPENAIDRMHTGVSRFAARYGFLDKPVRIRFRVLDPSIVPVPGTRVADIALDADNFAAMRLPVRRVLITENETNLLALPSTPDGIAIFGAGYGWDALAKAGWLDACEIHYWGDIDTHGFAILDGLRARFPHARSLLMDRETLLAHEAHWTQEAEPVRHHLARLNPDECALYDALRQDRMAQRLRLEQERIGYEWLRARLNALA
jgi:hypothetical protein